MQVYYFINEMYGLDDIRRRRLKISRIEDLNDPFELMSPTLPDRELRNSFAAIKHALSESKGILCFSGRWQNPVQWSHYADRHRGLCLGFALADHLVMPVEYVRRRIRLNIEALRGFGPAAEQEMKKVLCTKYCHWRYEHEVRCFVGLADKDEVTGHYFAEFSPDLALNTVIVGHRSSVSRADLQEAIGDYGGGVRVMKARLAFRSFRVVRQRLSRLWQ